MAYPLIAFVFALIVLIPCAARRIPSPEPTGWIGKLVTAWKNFDEIELVLQIMAWISLVIYAIVWILLEQ